jgi:predicted DNA binding CopG/RHH family protein
MKYDADEKELLNAIENGNVEKVPFDNEHIKKMASDSFDYLNQKKQITINMKQSDLDFVKQRAKDIGISYQNIIQALIHNYAHGKVELKI